MNIHPSEVLQLGEGEEGEGRMGFGTTRSHSYPLIG